MIDRFILPLQQGVLARPAAALAARGMRADQITLAGLALGVGAVAALWMGWYGLALGLILANRIADGLDGAVARCVGPTDRGAFLDIAADFLFYALVPLGFALADPGQNALAAAVLVAAFVGTGSSFLAFAAIAARHGMTAPAYPGKGIFYLGGLTEGAETIAVFAAMCLWPGGFASLAMVFSIACLATTVARWRMAWLAFDPQATPYRDEAKE